MLGTKGEDERGSVRGGEREAGETDEERLGVC